MMALEDKITNASNNSLISVNELDNAISFINPLILKIIMAFLIFLIGFAIGKIAEKLFLKLFDLIDLNKLVAKFARLKFSVSKLLARIIAYFIYIVSIVMGLNRLGITTTIITTIVILLIILLTLSIIFGFNEFFANMFAGLLLKFRKNIRVGEYIRIKDKDKNIEGHVISADMLNIRLETGKDEIVFIPNMALFKSEIIKIKDLSRHKKDKKKSQS
jgi:small-conductance mechanosensitive channel